MLARSRRGCARDAELAQARAGIMVGDRPRKARRDGGDAEHVDEEARQLEGPAGELVRARRPVRVVHEKLGIVHLDHAGARARRRDDVIEAAEALDDTLGEVARRRAIAGVVGGLAAAGLARHLDAAAGVLEELHRRKADGRPHQIDEAGDEQPDAHASLSGQPHLRSAPEPALSAPGREGQCGAGEGWRPHAVARDCAVAAARLGARRDHALRFRSGLRPARSESFRHQGRDAPEARSARLPRRHRGLSQGAEGQAALHRRRRHDRRRTRPSSACIWSASTASTSTPVSMPSGGRSLGRSRRCARTTSIGPWSATAGSTRPISPRPGEVLR